MFRNYLFLSAFVDFHIIPRSAPFCRLQLRLVLLLDDVAALVVLPDVCELARVGDRAPLGEGGGLSPTGRPGCRERKKMAKMHETCVIANLCRSRNQ